MQQENVFVSSFRFIAFKLIGQFLHFPIWWYTTGLFTQLKSFYKKIKHTNRKLAFSIWLRNLFTPMYGYTDWVSRLISFFVRFFILIYKTILFLLATVFYLILLILYMLLPIGTVFMFIRSLT